MVFSRLLVLLKYKNMKGGVSIMPFAVLADASAGVLDLSSTLSTALSGIQSSVSGMINVAMPVGLGIMGTILAVRIGVRFFRGLVA